MRDRSMQHGSFEWLCVCLILTPCAALAQQAGAAPQAAAASADAAPSAPAPRADHAPSAAPNTAPVRSAPATKPGDDIGPAVDTSPEGASRSSDARTDRSPPGSDGGAGIAQPDDRARTERERKRDAKPTPLARASGKATDHLELGTTDITGNRELPKVMYIVPWKRSDLGDLTGKPLNSLVDQTLEPVDRNVFERTNRYYGAVTAGATTGNTATGRESTAGASHDVHPTPGAGSGSAVRDEK